MVIGKERYNHHGDINHMHYHKPGGLGRIKEDFPTKLSLQCVKTF